MSTSCYCLPMTATAPTPGSIRYHGVVVPAVRKADGDVVAMVGGVRRFQQASTVAATFKPLDTPFKAEQGPLARSRAQQIVDAAAASHADDVARVAELERLLADARADAAASARVLADARNALNSAQ